MRLAAFLGAASLGQLCHVLARGCDNSTGYYIDPFSTDGETNLSQVSTADGCNGDLNCEQQLAALEGQSNAELDSLAEEGADGVTELAGVGTECDLEPSSVDCNDLKRRASGLAVAAHGLENVLKQHIFAPGRSHLHFPRSTQVIPRQSSTLQHQHTFACKDDQICVIFGDLPLCLSTSTGDFVDATGGHGNLVTGAYKESPAGSSPDAAGGLPSSVQEVKGSGTTAMTSMNRYSGSATPGSTSHEVSSSMEPSGSATSSSKADASDGSGSGMRMTALLVQLAVEMALALLVAAYIL